MKIENLIKGNIYRYNGFTDYFFEFSHVEGDYIVASYIISVIDKEVFDYCRLSHTSFYYRGVSTVDEHIRDWAKEMISCYKDKRK